MDIAQNLIKTQFPNWGNLAIRKVNSFGSDNILYRLGDDLVIRLPRSQRAVEQLKKEHFWLQKFSSLLPISIPRSISKGHATDEYPFDWSVYKWIEGDIFNTNDFQVSKLKTSSSINFIFDL